MGWFWADPATAPAPIARSPHRGTNMSGAPPPSCPMHVPAGTAKSTPTPSALLSNACPYVPEDGSSTNKKTTTSEPAPWSTRLNPLNMMPTFSQSRTSTQTFSLPTERTISSIPKGTDPSEGNWEYPSPQQMYNAMLRKGQAPEDAPGDAVVGMVSVHNFLNEGAWREILSWESQFGGGVGRGWRIATNGGEAPQGEEGLDCEPPRLLRFQGRPKDLTPKARMLQFLGGVYPSKFAGPAPFDRHDWFILRYPPGEEKGKAEEIRYVIDYYDAPAEETGEPVFFLDVRPAIDGPRAVVERGVRWGGEVWWKATGGVVREEIRRQKEEMSRRENEGSF